MFSFQRDYSQVLEGTILGGRRVTSQRAEKIFIIASFFRQDFTGRLGGGRGLLVTWCQGTRSFARVLGKFSDSSNGPVQDIDNYPMSWKKLSSDENTAHYSTEPNFLQVQKAYSCNSFWFSHIYMDSL